MRKILFQLFLLVLAAAGAGCAVKPEEAAPPEAVLDRESFYAVFDRKFTPEEARRASVTGDIAGRRIPFRLPESNTLDLKELCGKFTPVKDAAVISFTVTSKDGGVCRLGLAADNWHTCCLDGKVLVTTEPGGEAPGTPTYLKRGTDVRLKKGKNRFFVHTRPGRTSWVFSCGLLPDLDNWPQDPADRLTLFENAFPRQDAMLGPFVTHVSADRAAVCFEYSRNIAASLHYRESGAGTEEKILALPPVYGRIPRKKLFSP
ncbi:MAG: hypothetical protein IJU70_05135 [Lentisphaeria bacterium]|nr:hypothetical protein [Lentisphaeria bacterium]